MLICLFGALILFLPETDCANKHNYTVIKSNCIPSVSIKLSSDSIPIGMTFSFKDKTPFSLVFNFDSIGGSYFASKDDRIELKDLFYSHEESKGIGEFYYGEKYLMDSLYFYSELQEISFLNYYKVNFDKKEFVILEFQKNVMNIMPFEKSLIIVVDFTDPQNLRGIGFLSVIPDNFKKQIIVHNHRIEFNCFYWDRNRKLKAYKLKQDSIFNWRFTH